MGTRHITLHCHCFPSGSVYWALSVDYGHGKRYVILSGTLETIDEPEYAPETLVLGEALGAARAKERE